ncbi:MAG TPA: hypothetical protein VIP05_33715 [Burkholderiaceae bacterium]
MADPTFKITGDVKLAPPRFACACPTCGDALQTVPVSVPDHGQMRPLLLAWCMDCLLVKGQALGDASHG